MRDLHRGHWNLLTPDPANPLVIDRRALSHDLAQALKDAGFHPGPWPEFSPPPTRILRR
jgi:hypothetical protein